MNDQQQSEKKNWDKPELTVLVRNKPEEQVLQACKTAGNPSGNAGMDNDCMQTWVNCGGNSCDSYVGS